MNNIIANNINMKNNHNSLAMEDVLPIEKGDLKRNKQYSNSNKNILNNH
jgi:hypothetical protein